MTDSNDTDDSTSTDTEIGRDPTQLIPPQHDARMKVLGLIPWTELVYFVPAILMAGVVVVALAIDHTGLLYIGAIGGGLHTIVALALVLGTHEFTSPADTLKSIQARARNAMTYPQTDDETADEVDPVHGIERIHEDGTAEMHDGRVVGLVRVPGRNTDTVSQSELNRLAGQLADGFDSDVREFPVRYWSTTTEADLDALTGGYERQAYAEVFAGEEWAPARELLHSIVDWHRNVDAPAWQARQWHHYLVTEVRPWEVETGPTAPQSRGRRLLDSLSESVLFWRESETEAERQARRQRQRQELDRRRRTLAGDVVGGVDGLESESVSGVELAALLSRYWTGVEHGIGGGEGQESSVQAERLDSPEWLAPTDYDARGGQVRVGNELTRTFWIADWPTEPTAGFLADLYTLQGVDLDVCVRIDPRDKQTTLSELKHQVAQAGADAEELDDDSDLGALDADDSVRSRTRMYQLLRRTNTQPWDVAMYVTVRADRQAALDAAAEGTPGTRQASAETQMSVAAQRALEDAAERVRTVLERPPADALALAPTSRQHELFAAASPCGRDVYADVSTRQRTVLTLGGTLGAMFPFVGGDVCEPEGVEYGRNLQTGRELRADPFDRGGAPHQLTIAKSGSGKTYSVGKRALRWWMADPERTLVLCDTMGGFEGVTDVANGDHLVVDGSRTINPLAISETPDHLVSADVDPYRMKVDEAQEFIAGILRGQGIDPGEYVATIQEALEETYARAGITPDPDTHGLQSPTMAEFIATLEDMLTHPGEFTHTDHDREKAQKEEQVTRLLDKLSGFKPGGKFAHLVGHSETQITPSGVTYLDLQQIEGQGSAEKSTLLHLMLGQVYQTVKRAPGKTMFVIDEAHYLLHSEEMIEWLQRAARHWRHYSASLHMVSQRPEEFVAQGAGGEHRETIRGQCSTVEFFRTPGVADDILKRFGMNQIQREWVRSKATPGSSDKPYSQGLVSFADQPGWIRMQVAASPVEDDILTYEASDDGPFDRYLTERLGEVVG